MVKNPYYRQNGGRLPKDPPSYFGTVAKSVWTKIVPFLGGRMMSAKTKELEQRLKHIKEADNHALYSAIC